MPLYIGTTPSGYKVQQRFARDFGPTVKAHVFRYTEPSGVVQVNVSVSGNGWVGTHPGATCERVTLKQISGLQEDRCPV